MGVVPAGTGAIDSRRRVRSSHAGRSMIFTIARKELKSLFASPLAWLVLTLLQVLISGIWIFALLVPYVDIQSQPQMLNNTQGFTAVIVAPIYQLLSLIMLLVV